jgi:hypothetical protein
MGGWKKNSVGKKQKQKTKNTNMSKKNRLNSTQTKGGQISGKNEK